ncbi:MAG: NAD(P)-binding domain-containing protein [Deltaproteobacteria bacterium]|nr:NAD(P)-binding domain-containing protein [Deltaproteobacteria bacterium]
MISQEQICQVLEMVDGIVDIILMDAEIKVVGWEKAWILFHERVKKSRLLTFKPNDLTADALDVLLAQTILPLIGKKVAVIGAGNLGSKIALKLVERGCHVVLTRRDPEKLKKIAEGLNAIKSAHTKSEIHFTVDNCEACREADVVIGATAGTGAITREMIATMRTPGLIIDAGNGTILSEALEEAGRRGIRVLCLFMKPAYDGTIKTLFEVQNLIQKMERRCIGDFFILSGGVLGQKGDIIVDDVRSPKRILAIADGCGDVIPNIQEPAFRKNIAAVEALIGGEGKL